MPQAPASQCLDCLECRAVVGTDNKKVRCRKNAFKGILSIDHPFITLTRNCQQFNSEDEGGVQK